MSGSLASPISLLELARRFGLQLCSSERERATLIHALAPLDQATAGTLAPLLSCGPRRRAQARSSAASAFLLDRHLPELDRPQLVAAEPRRVLAALLEHFAPPPKLRAGVHRSAVIERRARIAADAWVGPFCYVASGARIGAGCQLASHVHIGEGAKLGARAQLGPHSAVLAGCVLGEGVEIAAGAVIGGEGFGFTAGPGAGLAGANLLRLRSLSHVELDDGVAVGANSCVDRGTLSPTRVAAGAKIDNLVQLGHNVQVGPWAVICAQAGLAGSVVVGAGAQLGGQAGVADNRSIGAEARVAAGSGVIGDVAEGQSVAGYPARPRGRWAREAALLSQLDQLRQRVVELERRGQDDKNAEE
ncbi:MAG: UDP-3-O-(3-hydroxymyristoyl)glucosamine N-acyltransferase [Deltaproteobacteria bacterium]|nr:MAG: UDP-3-O-(3-hydroxymyristoyl)glucosamine N-acyltransferase [Pseudomonadota bacterium]PIE66141.1 MAG: UDP-3-O-(3-hydroxymyristoyl)glucosamine N-acyltransferase [Deltaproteobacteria bacterium]